MHFAISTTWGPTDTTRAAIPFIFAATALEKGDSVTLMLFHDAVSIAVPGTHENIVPVAHLLSLLKFSLTPRRKLLCANLAPRYAALVRKI